MIVHHVISELIPKENQQRMASSLKGKRVKEFGKYGEESEFRNENGRPHEKSRVLAAETVDYIRCCDECGKHVDKVKTRFECSCKLPIYCSKFCFKSSSHKCDREDEEILEAHKDKFLSDPENNDRNSYNRDIQDKSVEAVSTCAERFANDNANGGPSSEKITHLKKMSRGDHRRILNVASCALVQTITYKTLKYGEARNPTAALLIGHAYVAREFDRRADFAIPVKYKEQSKDETNKIGIKWLKVAAEGGVPEAMFLLFWLLNIGGNWRDAQYWVAEAHATGKMDYVSQILETPAGTNCPHELDFMHHQITKGLKRIVGETLGNLLVATRFKELKLWGSKTAMGKPFYGWGHFNKLMKLIGELKNDRAMPSFIVGEKETIVIVIARPGFLDLIKDSRRDRNFEREENNVKFVQGVKDQVSLDYQLVGHTSNEDGRTSYFIACKHSPIDDMVEGLTIGQNKSLEDLVKKFKYAGKCELCVEEAKLRLRAVSLGLFSLSITPIFPPLHYAARYSNEDGVIIQDVFKGYSKPYMRQTLQCLMSNPEDLHPLAVAENAMLFWPIIWFWGSVYEAVQDCCDKVTLDAIYDGLGHKVEVVESDNASALAAFPEAAAGEWRIACGNEDCPKVDHEVKFNLCKGCKVRRYCSPVCHRQDWPKHQQLCKAGKKGEN